MTREEEAHAAIDRIAQELHRLVDARCTGSVTVHLKQGAIAPVECRLFAGPAEAWRLPRVE